MFCRFCGKEIKDQAKFCGFCGNSQELPKEPAAKKPINILNCVFGLLFILGGILPYLLPGDYEAYNYYISSLASRSDVTYAAAVCFQKFYNFLAPLFYFSSSALSVYVGLQLIKRDQNLKLPLVFCFIVHILSVIFTGVVNLLVYFAPRFAVSLFTPNPSVLEAAEELIRSEPDLLSYYQDQAFRRLIISIVLIVLALIFLSSKKRSAVKDEKKPSCIGGILMILSLALLSVIGNPLSALSMSIRGSSHLLSYSAAGQSMSLTISPAALYIFMVLMAIGVFFTRTKRWILTLSTAGAIGLLTLLVCLFARLLIEEDDLPASLFALTLSFFRGFTINSAAILIAMFCWFNALSRNRIPKWLQIALPVSVPILYVFGSPFAKESLYYQFGISFIVLFISLLTILLSLLVRSKESKLQK